MSKEDTLITFGIIVLNGEPFTKYCIRALYPHAHEIIVAEGACEGAYSVATTDGHSSDGTLESLRELKKSEDPEGKITIVTAEDEGHKNGFWPGEKHEQSRAYAKRATGNWLWQVDIDEFYSDDTLIRVKNLLKNDKSISTISFRQVQFWGGFQYLVDSWLLRRGAHNFHRLFKWETGYIYTTHRPPTVVNSEGNDLRSVNWIKAEEAQKMGLILYHYSFVFPKQVYEKAQYYKNADWSRRDKADWWANEVYLKLSSPFRVFSIYWDFSWLKRFKGTHPEQINKMIADIDKGNLKIELRGTSDIESLLMNPFYRFTTGLLIFINPIDEVLQRYYKSLKRKLKLFFR